MNTTTVDTGIVYTLEDYYIVASLSVSFCFIALVISIIISVLIWRTKSRLHTVHHLSVCNTCIASIFYCITTTNNYLFLIFIGWDTSDMNCRRRAYFAYVGIAGVMYSYLIQAISRFYFSILSSKYRWLATFKTYYILICSQWFVLFLITSSTLKTKDITFHPDKLCLINISKTLHVSCAIFAYYIIPLLIIIIIYIYIYHRVRKTKKNATTMPHSNNNRKRDLEVLRNIVILISIYLGGGLPTIIFFLTPTKYPYLVNLVIQSLAVAIAKLDIVLLDREIRQVIKRMICRTTSVMPYNNAFLVGRNATTFKGTKHTNIQHLRSNIPSKFY